ncbi:hypothetical protein HYT51_01760, partial [Candidatus Woesearchaeota archaeon]|nr:hypothetical protein [Candidatus Woesearchaeota archaeon]
DERFLEARDMKAKNKLRETEKAEKERMEQIEQLLLLTEKINNKYTQNIIREKFQRHVDRFKDFEEEEAKDVIRDSLKVESSIKEGIRGETKVYRLGGKDWEISVDYETEPRSIGSLKYSINGKEVEVDYSDVVYIDGLIFKVEGIFYQSAIEGEEIITGYWSHTISIVLYYAGLDEGCNHRACYENNIYWSYCDGTRTIMIRDCYNSLCDKGECIKMPFSDPPRKIILRNVEDKDGELIEEVNE